MYAGIDVSWSFLMTSVKKIESEIHPGLPLLWVVCALTAGGVWLGISPGPASTPRQATSAEAPVATDKSLTADECKQIALDALGEPDLVLTPQGLRSHGHVTGKGKECYHFTGPAVDKVIVDVDSTTGTVFRLQRNREAFESQTVKVSMEEAEKTADGFLRKFVPLPAEAHLKQTQKELFDGGGLGKSYRFAWRRKGDAVGVPWNVALEVSAQTGNVTRLFHYDNPIRLKNLTPKLSRDDVLKIALPRVDLVEGWKWLEPELGVAGGAEQYLVWTAQAEGILAQEYISVHGQYGDEGIRSISINDATGKIYSTGWTNVRPRKRIMLIPPIPQPKAIVAWDTWPVFLPDDSLAWSSQLPLTYTPRVNNLKNVIGHTANGKSTAWLSLPLSNRHLAVAPNTGRIAFDAQGESVIYILDPVSGTIGQCNDTERATRHSPSWDPGGKLLAMAGTHSPSDNVGEHDDDIIVAEISRRLGLNSTEDTWCVAHLPGTDSLPVFSPDGKTIVFAHEERPAPAKDVERREYKEPTWSIYTVSATKSFDAEGYSPPKKIAALPRQPERLSWFPNGKQVLVGYWQEPYEPATEANIVDLETKQCKPFKLPVLHDRGLSNGKPLAPSDLVVNASGTKLAFSALRWSGNTKDNGAICLYTCNLKGSGVKRITPYTGQPPILHQYPQQGVTALNAWEKLAPARSDRR